MMSTFIDDIKNAFRKKDNSLNQIILINVIVFVALLLFHVVVFYTSYKPLYDTVLSWLELPSNLSFFITKPWTLVSYFFLHEHPFHILFNLLALFWFGQIIGDLIGGKHVTSLYVLGGIMGGLFYLAAFNLIPALKVYSEFGTLKGASAGVNAVMMAGATLVPDYPIHLLLFGQVRLRYVALGCIIISLLQIISMNVGGGIAHFGGIFIGYIFIVQLKRGYDIGKPITFLTGFVGNLFKKRETLKITYKNSAKSKSNAHPSQEEVDAILDKISQSGYESLTKDEKQKLFHASQTQ